MKTYHLFAAVAAAAVVLVLATSAQATTITATDVSNASPNPASGNLQTNNLTIGNVTLSTTPRNLGWEAASTTIPEMFGVQGGGKPGQIGDLGIEMLTMDFSPVVALSQLSMGRQGANDIRIDVTGFSSDPGAVLTPADPNETDVFEVTYDNGTGTLSVASRVGGVASGASLGSIGWYDLDFANEVPVTSLVFSSPSNSSGAGGVGIASFTFEVVPEPSVLCLGMFGLVCLPRRTRLFSD